MSLPIGKKYVSLQTNLKIVFNMEKKKQSVISLDEIGKMNRDKELRFIEEIRRDENGEIVAYVMKRNPKYKG